MLGKLWKHEMRAQWPSYAGTVAAYLGVCLLALGAWALRVQFLMTLAMLVLMLYSMAMIIVHIVLQIRRFYQSMIGSGAYLSYATPVSLHALLAPKLLFAFVSTLCVYGIVAGGMLCGMRLLYGGLGIDPQALDVFPTGVLAPFVLVLIANSVNTIFSGLLGMSLIPLPALKQRNASIPIAAVTAYGCMQLFSLLVLVVFIVIQAFRLGHLDLNAIFGTAETQMATFMWQMSAIYAGMLIVCCPVIYAVATRLLGRHRQI